MCRHALSALLCCMWAGPLPASAADSSSALHLVPFPKQVAVQPGVFPLTNPLTMEAPQDAAARLADLINAELQHVVCRTYAAAPVAARPHAADRRCGRSRAAAHRTDQRSAGGGLCPRNPAPRGPLQRLGRAGLLYATQTLCQLIRANRADSGLPCLTIRDWPSLRWRCFQDDLTRGPSSTLATLQAAGRSGRLPEDEPVHLLHGVPVRLPEAPADRAARRLADAGGAGGAWSSTPSRCTSTSWATSSRSATSAILKHERVRRPARDGRTCLPGQGRDLSAAGRPVLRGLPAAAVPVLQRLLRRDLGPGHGAVEGTGREDRRGRRLRPAHPPRPRPAQGKIRQAHDDVGRHHPAAPRQLDEIPKDTVMLTWGYGSGPSFEQPDRALRQVGLRVLRLPGREQLEPHPARLRRDDDRTSTTSCATAPSTGRSACSTPTGRTTAKR